VPDVRGAGGARDGKFADGYEVGDDFDAGRGLKPLRDLMLLSRNFITRIIQLIFLRSSGQKSPNTRLGCDIIGKIL
jgi:hypothetical protein